jgi:hypothetical protein
MGGHGQDVLGSKKMSNGLVSPNMHRMQRLVFLSINKIMKGLVAPFLSLQSYEHRLLDGSFVELSVLFPVG